MLAITWGSFVNSTKSILSWLKLLFSSRSAKGTFPPKRRCSPSSPAASGSQAALGAAIHEVCVWGTAWESREDVLSGRLLVQRRGLISGRGLVHVSPRRQQLLPAPRSGRAGLCESQAAPWAPRQSPLRVPSPSRSLPLPSVRFGRLVLLPPAQGLAGADERRDLPGCHRSGVPPCPGLAATFLSFCRAPFPFAGCREQARRRFFFWSAFFF